MDPDFPSFSNETIQRLQSAGWSPDREVDLTTYTAAFEEEGLRPSVQVCSFLKRFGGLIIPYMTQAHQEDTLDFLADEAVQGLGGGALRSYEEMAGVGGLSPIGHFGSGAVLLMMAPTGQVYGAVNWKLVCLGQNAPEAIEKIIAGLDIRVPADGAPGVLRATIDQDKLLPLEFQDYSYCEHLSRNDVCEV